jgi:hypothetical protein
MKNFRKFLTEKVTDFRGYIINQFIQNPSSDMIAVNECMRFMLNRWVDDVVREYEKSEETGEEIVEVPPKAPPEAEGIKPSIFYDDRPISPTDQRLDQIIGLLASISRDTYAIRKATSAPPNEVTDSGYDHGF